MGVIQIRRAQEKLQNLGNVRMVDTSGIAKSSAAGLETIGKSISGLGRDLGSGMNSINNVIERDHERQANEAALAFRKDMDARLNGGLDKDGKPQGLFTKMTTGDGTSRGDAAKAFDDDFKTALTEAKAAVKADKMNADVRRRFNEKVANYTQSKLNEGNNLANAVWSANTRGAAAAYLAEVTKDAAQNPSDAALTAVDKAIDERAFAEGWTAEQTRVEREKTAETIGAAIIDNKLALCQTDEDYARLESVLSNKPGAVNEEEVAKLLPGAAKKFVDNLTPEQRRKASEMVASKRYRAATIRNETFSNKVAEVTNKAVANEVTSKNVTDAIDELSKGGAPEKMLTPLYRIREVLFNGECTRQAMDLFAAIEQRGDVTNYKKAVEEAVKALPENVQKNDDFVKAMNQLTLAGQKAFEERLKVSVGTTRETYLYGDVGMAISISDRKALLAEHRTKYPSYYTMEQHQSDLAKLDQIQKQGDEAILNEAVVMLQEVAPAQSFKSDKGLTIVDLTSAFQANDPLASGIGKLYKTHGKGSDVSEQDIRNTWQEYYRAQDAWLDACRENPTWTKKERAQLFYETVVSPTFDRLSRAKLHQTPEQYWQGLGKSIEKLNRLAEMGRTELKKDVPFSSIENEIKAQPAKYSR